jgi:hypothetical protein
MTIMENDSETRPRKALRSILDEEGGRLTSPAVKRAVENAVAPLGIVRTQRVPTAGEAKVQFNIRASVEVRERLNHYAYVERLTLGQAIEKLLNIAEEKRG